jgi:hypothetical protein
MIKEITQEEIMARDALIHICEAKQYIKSLGARIVTSNGSCQLIRKWP